MDIDWTSPLISRKPSRACDRDKLGHAKKRSHPKRHGENRERSRIQSAKARMARLVVAKRVQEVIAYKQAVAAYFRGERDHPTALSQHEKAND